MSRLDAELLLASGAVEGPFRITKPITLSWRVRFVRWVCRFTTRR